MKIMTAKYAGTCRECSRRILVGAKIGFAGRGRAYHVECTDGGAAPTEYYGRTSQGFRRCEDAPCCGCCG